MKFWWLFSLLVIVLSSCSDSDENTLVGKWKYSRLEKNGTLFLSDDLAERRQIIDKHVSENNEYIKDVAHFRSNAEKEMDTRLEVYFDLKEDSTAIISDFTQGSNISNWKYLVDHDAKTISFLGGEHTSVYSFTLKENKLMLVDRENNVKIDLVKQEE